MCEEEYFTIVDAIKKKKNYSKQESIYNFLRNTLKYYAKIYFIACLLACFQLSGRMRYLLWCFFCGISIVFSSKFSIIKNQYDIGAVVR